MEAKIEMECRAIDYSDSDSDSDSNAVYFAISFSTERRDKLVNTYSILSYFPTLV